MLALAIFSTKKRFFAGNPTVTFFYYWPLTFINVFQEKIRTDRTYIQIGEISMAIGTVNMVWIEFFQCHFWWFYLHKFSIDDYRTCSISCSTLFDVNGRKLIFWFKMINLLYTYLYSLVTLNTFSSAMPCIMKSNMRFPFFAIKCFS